MRWLVVAVGVVFGTGTAWLVHRPVAPVEVVVVADANAGIPHAGGEVVEQWSGGAAHVPAPGEGSGSSLPPDRRERAAGEDALIGGQAKQGADDTPTSRSPAPLAPGVEQALAKWARDGRSGAAAKALRKAGDTALAETIEAIDGLRRAGQGAFLEGELEEADARWGEAILRERNLPLGRPSAASNELRSRLASAWHDRALVHESRGQLAVAFAIWQRATAIDPSHLDSLAGLQRVAGSAAGDRGSEAALPRAWPTPQKR